MHHFCFRGSNFGSTNQKVLTDDDGDECPYPNHIFQAISLGTDFGYATKNLMTVITGWLLGLPGIVSHSQHCFHCSGSNE